MFAAAGLVLFVGVLIDLGVLWVLQRQDSPHWRFIALSATTNSYPPLLLSLVLMYFLNVAQRAEETLVVDAQEYCQEHLLLRLYDPAAVADSVSG